MVSKRDILRIYRAERAKFAALCPDVLDVELVLVDRHFDPDAGDRDIAWFEQSDNSIYFVKRGLAKSLGHIVGILRHELGHAIDDRINEPGCERRADRLARKATGSPIRYTRDGLQHATHGVARRPGWLHQ
jgi:hypothetical protein